MMSVDENLMCSFQILKPNDGKKGVPIGMGRPNTPPRGNVSPFNHDNKLEPNEKF